MEHTKPPLKVQMEAVAYDLLRGFRCAWCHSARKLVLEMTCLVPPGQATNSSMQGKMLPGVMQHGCDVSKLTAVCTIVCATCACVLAPSVPYLSLTSGLTSTGFSAGLGAYFLCISAAVWKALLAASPAFCSSIWVSSAPFRMISLI